MIQRGTRMSDEAVAAISGEVDFLEERVSSLTNSMDEYEDRISENRASYDRAFALRGEYKRQLEALKLALVRAKNGSEEQ